MWNIRAVRSKKREGTQETDREASETAPMRWPSGWALNQTAPLPEPSETSTIVEVLEPSSFWLSWVLDDAPKNRTDPLVPTINLPCWPATTPVTGDEAPCSLASSLPVLLSNMIALLRVPTAISRPSLLQVMHSTSAPLRADQILFTIFAGIMD